MQNKYIHWAQKICIGNKNIFIQNIKYVNKIDTYLLNQYSIVSQ